MKKGIIIQLCLWASIMLPIKGLWAQTPLLFDEIGCGPRAIALGQAFTAVADDVSAAYYNPAGLSQLTSKFTMSLGYQYIKPIIYIDVNNKDGTPYVPPPYLNQRAVNRSEDISTRGLWVGIGANFAYLKGPKGRPNPLRHFSMGFVLFNGLPYVNNFFNPQRRQDPYHLRYNYGFCLMNMALSMSTKITDYLSIGIGLLPRIDTFTSSVGNYLILDKVVNAADPDNGLRLNLKTRAQAYAEYVAGVLLRPPFLGLKDRLSLGITYQRELSGFYGTGPSTDDVVYIDPLTGDKVLLFPLTAFVVDFIGFNPAQVSAGLALKPFSGMIISADVTWKDYSKFKFFWHLFPEPRFHDTWTPRIGLEYALDPFFETKILNKIDVLKFQGGYYYDPSPVPDMNGPMNILDSAKHVISFGTGLDYRLKGLKALQVQGYFQVHLARERVLDNTEELLFGVIRTGGEVYSTGINITIHL